MYVVTMMLINITVLQYLLTFCTYCTVHKSKTSKFNRKVIFKIKLTVSLDVFRFLCYSVVPLDLQ